MPLVGGTYILSLFLIVIWVSSNVRRSTLPLWRDVQLPTVLLRRLTGPWSSREGLGWWLWGGGCGVCMFSSFGRFITAARVVRVLRRQRASGTTIDFRRSWLLYSWLVQTRRFYGCTLQWGLTAGFIIECIFRRSRNFSIWYLRSSHFRDWRSSLLRSWCGSGSDGWIRDFLRRGFVFIVSSFLVTGLARLYLTGYYWFSSLRRQIRIITETIPQFKCTMYKEQWIWTWTSNCVQNTHPCRQFWVIGGGWFSGLDPNSCSGRRPRLRMAGGRLWRRVVVMAIICVIRARVSVTILKAIWLILLRWIAPPYKVTDTTLYKAILCESSISRQLHYSPVIGCLSAMFLLGITHLSEGTAVKHRYVS